MSSIQSACSLLSVFITHHMSRQVCDQAVMLWYSQTHTDAAGRKQEGCSVLLAWRQNEWRAKKRSSIWMHFSLETTGIAKCNICKNLISSPVQQITCTDI
ncbi:hypothetical protein ATANTOWER_009161 [Ataeniobius toweri]|uniref:Secreted protein n=1 Tax=Ataeniobius toweri TaxID=208326 RepID=A0ABU7BY50_9TELE|nr:hypothetical protein [Ataeniobius toweri]